jgi:hypothetical protein
MESCANCGARIGDLETPAVWNDRIVCGPCYARLAPVPLAYSGPPQAAPTFFMHSTPTGPRVSGLGTASLVLGLVGLVFFCVPPSLHRPCRARSDSVLSGSSRRAEGRARGWPSRVRR